MALCNWLSAVNASLMMAGPELPLLYDAGIIYQRESAEHFRDVVNMYRAGFEDCDSLAPARAGELIARGWRAMRKGDAGYDAAMRSRPSNIEAVCFFTTRDDPDDPGPKLYHVEVAYWINGVRYEDDPSARLGMYDGEIDPVVLSRWKRAGVHAGNQLSVGFLPVEVRSWR